MAYVNFLLAAPESQVNALGYDATFTLKPSKVTAVSHLLGYWVRIQPLGELLGRSLDGGQIVNSDLWHPLRAPVFHDPASVKSLYGKIANEWKKITGDPPKDNEHFDWYCSEMSRFFRCSNTLHIAKNVSSASSNRLPIENGPVVCAYRSRGRSRYGHTFGGPHDRKDKRKNKFPHRNEMRLYVLVWAKLLAKRFGGPIRRTLRPHAFFCHRPKPSGTAIPL